MQKKRIMNARMVYAVLLAVFAFSLPGTVLAMDDEAAIDRVRLAFNTAYNAGNADAMAVLIDRDAVWMPPTGEQAIVGVQDILARYTAFFQKTRSAFELQPGKIQISGRWAFLDGPWHRTDSAIQGGKLKLHGGYYMMAFKKQSDGSWKIARDIWNDARKP